jgi:hypothetical protein
MPGLPRWAPAFIAGVPPQAEGAHLAVGTIEIGNHSLDGFLRMLLPQLIHFREITGHPGFNWQAMAGEAGTRINYLTSITLETDPVRAKAALDKYAAEIDAEFAATNKGAEAKKDRS